MAEIDIWSVLRRHGIRPYREAEVVAPALVTPEAPAALDALVVRNALAPGSPIARIFNRLVKYAIKDRASAIHIEPGQSDVPIFFVIDGELREQARIPLYVLEPLLLRIKVMSEMDATECEVPQDGTIQISLLDRHYRLDVGTTPTLFGEKIIIHIN